MGSMHLSGTHVVQRNTKGRRNSLSESRHRHTRCMLVILRLLDSFGRDVKIESEDNKQGICVNACSRPLPAQSVVILSVEPIGRSVMRTVFGPSTPETGKKYGNSYQVYTCQSSDRHGSIQAAFMREKLRFTTISDPSASSRARWSVIQAPDSL